MDVAGAGIIMVGRGVLEAGLGTSILTPEPADAPEVAAHRHTPHAERRTAGEPDPPTHPTGAADAPRSGASWSASDPATAAGTRSPSSSRKRKEMDS